MSHAAPKHHFGDRAGLLTALAVDGFVRLGAALREAATTGAADGTDQLAVLGRTYLDFGLADPELFELMFRMDELHPRDSDLRAAQAEAFTVLASTVTGGAADEHGDDDQPPGPLGLVAWAFVHGLVVLTRDGALQTAAGTETPSRTADLARSLTDTSTDRLGQRLRY